MLLNTLGPSIVSSISNAQASQHVLYYVPEGVGEAGSIQKSEKKGVNVRGLHFMLIFEIFGQKLLFSFD